MLKKIQRVFCVLMCTVMLFSFCQFADTAEAVSTVNTPTIYITGRRSIIYDKNGKKIYPMTKGISSVINDNMNDVIAAGTKGVLTGNWVPMRDLLYDLISPLFKDQVLNANGEISNGSYVQKNTEPKKTSKSSYGLSDYKFEYDSRIDPWEVARQLRSYVNKVLKATGKKKVSIIGRCMGADILACYLVRYKSDPKVDTSVFYAPACNGILIVGAPFSGRISLDKDELKKAANSGSVNEDGELEGMLKTFYKVLGPLGVNIANSELKEAIPVIMPKLLLATYATMPAYWAMVADEYYEDAIKFVFGSNARKGKYKKLIEKTDFYQNNVRAKLPSVLKSLQKSGMKINVISKHGVDFDPIYEGVDQRGDGWLELKNSSFGATASKKGKTLSTSYINSLVKSGCSSYLSSDKTIDSTTCLFPDSTWFIKNMAHTNWSSGANDLLCRMINSTKQFTIKSSSSYPQFLKYSSGKLEKLTSYDQLFKPVVSSVTLSKTQYTYDGKVKTPHVTVKNAAGKTLKKNTDYTVTASSGRKNIGKYSVKVTFKGDYKKEKARTLTFKIVPANVKLKYSLSGSNAILSWSKVAGAKKYRIYVYDANTNKCTKKINTTSTKYKFTSLKQGSVYVYAVRAYATSGSTNYYSPSYSKAVIVRKPAAPKISVKLTNSRTATISWNYVAGGSRYEIYRATSKDGNYKLIDTVAKSPYTNTGLYSFRKYYYKVRAVKIYAGVKYGGSFSSIAATK